MAVSSLKTLKCKSFAILFFLIFRRFFLRMKEGAFLNAVFFGHFADKLKPSQILQRHFADFYILLISVYAFYFILSIFYLRTETYLLLNPVVI